MPDNPQSINDLRLAALKSLPKLLYSFLNGVDPDNLDMLKTGRIFQPVRHLAKILSNDPKLEPSEYDYFRRLFHDAMRKADRTGDATDGCDAELQTHLSQCQ